MVNSTNIEREINMELTRENEMKIRELTRIEEEFDINKVYTCQKGSFQKIIYVSDNGINAKGKKENLIKLSIGVVRVGITYANLKANQGLELTGELKGKTWKRDKYLLETTKGNELLRVYTCNLPNVKTKTYYLLNGEIKTKEWLRENEYLLKEQENPLPKKCFDININNILAFGNN